MEAYCYYGALLFYLKQWNISDVENCLVIIKTLDLKTSNNLIHFKFSFIGICTSVPLDGVCIF
jgi:hypothetical protein